jgi:hypothetical protein
MWASAVVAMFLGVAAGTGLAAAMSAPADTTTLTPGQVLTVSCPNKLGTSGRTAHALTLSCAPNSPPPTTTPRTTIPTTSTTLPPTTVPTTTPGPAGSWPTQDNTGSSGTLTDVTPPTGELILDQPNQVLANTRVHGTVTVLGCGVTLHNVEVDASETFTGDASTPDLFAVWLKEDPSCGVTLDHVSVLTPTGYATEAVRDAYGGPATVTSLKAVGQQLGMTVGSGTVMRDSYIQVAPTLRGDHNEAILDDGIDGLTLTHNTFLNPNGQTSALSLFTEFGPNHNVLVQDNFLAGGGYTCYCGDGKSDNAGQPAPASNVSFVANVFSEKYFPTVGAFGPGRAYNPAGGGQWTTNVYALPDGTVTTQLVPQPPLDGQ